MYNHCLCGFDIDVLYYGMFSFDELQTSIRQIGAQPVRVGSIVAVDVAVVVDVAELRLRRSGAQPPTDGYPTQSTGSENQNMPII